MALTTGDASDRGVVAHAANTVRMAHGELLVVYVIKMNRSLPVDAEVKEEVELGENVLEQAERTARLPKNSFDTQLLQAREIGPAVIHEAAIRDVDEIVIGMSYPEQTGKFALGDHVHYVLEHAASRVILLRETPQVLAEPEEPARLAMNGARS